MKDGGPAFPRDRVTKEVCGDTIVLQEHSSGMTLRDYFAGQVIEATIIDACCTNFLRAKGNVEPTSKGGEQLATEAYAIADLMIKQRDKESKQ